MILIRVNKELNAAATESSDVNSLVLLIQVSLLCCDGRNCHLVSFLFLMAGVALCSLFASHEQAASMKTLTCI